MTGLDRALEEMLDLMDKEKESEEAAEKLKVFQREKFGIANYDTISILSLISFVRNIIRLEAEE